MKKKYLPLGSCRVVNTISYEIEHITLINQHDLWFTHYPDEHIQKINHLYNYKKIPEKHKEFFVRYEQESHYKEFPKLRVGESISTGKTEIFDDNHRGTLNVAVELPTTRHIRVLIGEESFWGHTTNTHLITNSQFKHIIEFYTDDQFIEKLNQLEKTVTDAFTGSPTINSINFIYIPHTPFIQLKEGGWGISQPRTRTFEIINRHCSKTPNSKSLPTTRCSLDVKTMIEQNGGVKYMLEDQDHYSPQGRKIAYNYIDKLSL